MSSSLIQRSSAAAYDAFMHPLERFHLSEVRRALVGRARGDVLEIGAGSGVNLSYYDTNLVDRLTVSDRNDRTMIYRERRERLGGGDDKPFVTARIDAQKLPFPDASFDTVVATLVFCSVECAPCGFEEIARVLRPGGRYLFLEHVRPARPFQARVFDWVNPVWNRVSGGCNLNRDTLKTIREAGFAVTVESPGGHDENGVFVWGEASLPVFYAGR